MCVSRDVNFLFINYNYLETECLEDCLALARCYMLSNASGTVVVWLRCGISQMTAAAATAASTTTTTATATTVDATTDSIVQSPSSKPVCSTAGK